MIPQHLIFLVEDNDDDAELTMKAFKVAKIANPVMRAHDGVEALDYFLGRGNHAGRNMSDAPVIVLLDLKLLRLSGLEVLKAVHADECTKHLPIVILTSSNEDRDRLSAYDQFANSYVLKGGQFPGEAACETFNHV